MRRLFTRLALSGLLALTSFTVQGEEAYRLLRLDGHLVKWGSSELGTGATVTYAFVTERMRFPGARNCADMAPLDPLLAASRIPPARFLEAAATALASWEQAADITFRRASDPATANILIGAQAAPRGWAYANVTYAPSEAGGARSIDRGLVCLNPSRPWQVGFDGEAGGYDLTYVLTHELGHAIGLNHPGSHDEVMSYRYPERFRGLQPGDIEGAVSLYGARRPTTTIRPVKAKAVRAAVPAAD